MENNPNASIFKEMRQARGEILPDEGGTQDGSATELPQGASPVEASAEAPVEQEAAPEETPQAPEGGADEGALAAAAEAEPDEPVRIGGQTFKNAKEALEYAERIERERELTEAHTAGVREALEAVRQPAAPQAEPEEDFDTEFYTNPKEALRKVKESAVAEAEARLEAKQTREALWSEFLSANPDIRRQDAQRILDENMNTIGKLKDKEEVFKRLALKVRAEYDEIADLRRPRTALPDKKQTVQAGGGAPPRVTQEKKEDRPLSFADQLRNMNKSRSN